MASIIPGYEYDIFISYRQKDNKYDGWVTEFVDNLQRELESTFKETISVYFDFNQVDGLLESHDVNASLRDKLKCLVFIPILSRTYCDPNSFAWENEFKAFINLATQDKFGLNITLPNSNVAKRVLPVCVNDLDINDTKLFESLTDGVLRGIDFIYKSRGVNRPLRHKEENPYDNLNHTIYRDQINKVSLAIKDVIESMKHPVVSTHLPEKKNNTGESLEIRPVVYESVSEDIAKSDKKENSYSSKPKTPAKYASLRRQWILVPVVLTGVAILFAVIFFINHVYKVKWAKNVALTDIERLINRADIVDAFSLVQKAKRFISNDSKFKELESLVESDLTVLTDPPGADVYIREYSDSLGEWKKLGKTPFSIKVAGSSFYLTSSFYLMRIEKPGYENILAVSSTQKDTLYRKLFLKGTLATGMVYVERYWDEVRNIVINKNSGFFMDRYEVTNKQFKEFLKDGGYRNPKYWEHNFIINNKILSLDEAMAQFIDKSGRTGPATWEAGDYPEGHDNYPVTGISWYEAAAYAVYAGKSLPTKDHWDSGAGFYFQGIKFFSKIIPISNFNRKGPDPSGKNKGVTLFGAFDMAGNVREWCSNESPVGHTIVGGGWDDVEYMFNSWSQLPSFDRSPENGLRCVKYIDKGKIPETAFRKIDIEMDKDFSNEKPVPEKIFRIYRNQFLYDSTDLKAVIEKKDTTSENWTTEKITFNAAYGKERMIAYLFLPRNISPPFQTLIYFPGIGARFEKDVIKSSETKWFIDYILKSGRAVMCPCYKGTFDRADEPIARNGHRYTEWVIKWVKDFSRSVDYLETRPDINKRKLGYYGHSWGGYMGGIIPAVEKRLAVSILVLGGLDSGNYPEDEVINYVSRINIPVLMLNGRYDTNFHFEKTVLPFFNLLGTPKKDKRLVVYDTDHYIPKNEMIKEVLNFLDNYFGSVQ